MPSMLSNVNLNKNQLTNHVVHLLAADPSGGGLTEGLFWYNTVSHALKYYDGTDVVTISASTGLTQEQVEDIVGGMVSGNTETNITVTYDDTNGKLDFVVGATYTDEMARDAIGTALVAGNNIDITVNDGADTITIDVESLTSADITDFAEAVSDQVGAMVTGNTETGITVTYDDADNTLDFAVDTEFIADTVGAMTTGNTETGITVTYQDADNTIDFEVATLNNLPAPTGDLSLNSQKITNLAAGTAETDAVTLGQLNSVSAGLDWKASVRVATTAAGTLATSFENGDTVDGVVLATGNRILIKDQASGSENGIYVVAASGAPTRALDANTSAEVTGGMAVWVNEGTTNADTGWVLTTNDTITLDTTNLVFTQFSGLGQVTAGAALTKTGNQLDVAVDTTTIEVSSDALRISATAAGNGLTGGGASALAVGAGNGITVNANDVAIASTVAGDGLTHTTGVLAVGAGAGISVAADAVAIDTAVVVRKAAFNVGDNVATAFVLTHNLNTRDVTVGVYLNSGSYEQVMPDIENTSVNTVTLRFAVAPTTDQYRAVVHG